MIDPAGAEIVPHPDAHAVHVEALFGHDLRPALAFEGRVLEPVDARRIGDEIPAAPRASDRR